MADAGSGFNPFSFLIEGQSQLVAILLFIFFLMLILFIIPKSSKRGRF